MSASELVSPVVAAGAPCQLLGYRRRAEKVAGILHGSARRGGAIVFRPPDFALVGVVGV